MSLIHHKTLPCIFSIAILAAHFHCLVQHARELRAKMPCPTFAAAPDSPVTPGCENESACICKGATLAAMVDVPAVDSSWVDWSDTLAASTWRVAAETVAQPAIEPPQERAACLSAQKLRALLQTYLI